VNVLELNGRITFQNANPNEVDTALVNNQVMERYSEVDLADEATEALKLEREGKREEAESRMLGSLGRHQPYMSPQDADHYRELSKRIKTGMTETDRKQYHSDVYNKKRKKSQGEEKKKD